MHDGPVRGGGGLQCFKKFFFFLKLIFFLETLQSPRPHVGAVVHDGSSMGAGGLQCNRATSQRWGRGGLNFF
jgi:hypothetical protein